MTAADETTNDEVRRDPRTGRIVEGTWPISCEQRAFVEGAKWWEWTREGATMFSDDTDRAALEALRRYGVPTAALASAPRADETTRVVTAFIAPHNAQWQGLPVNVRADGSWWLYIEGAWVENIPAMPTAKTEKTNDSFAASPQEV